MKERKRRMSSPDSSLVAPEITEESSVPELITFVRSSFRQEDFDEVERLLVGREEKMEMELRNLRRDYEEMKKECQLLEAQKLELEEKLNRSRIECQELRQQLVEAEDMVELRDCQLMDFSSRGLNLEEAVARLLRVPVTIVRNFDGKELLQSNVRMMNGRDVVLCSTDVQAVCDAPEVGTNSIYLEKENKTSLAAALINTDNGCDSQMGVPNQLVIQVDSSNLAAASCIPVGEAAGSPIVVEISDSDEQNLPAWSAHILTSRALDVNSTGKKGNSTCFVKTDKENGTDAIEDSDIHFLPKRKRSMTETNDTNFMVARRRKKEESGQLVCGEKGSLGSDNSVKLDYNSAGLETFLPSVQSYFGEVRKGGDVQIDLAKSLFDDTDNSSDCTSSDSDNESSLEAYVDKMVAIAKGYRLKTWNFAADVLSDLEKDDELCMNAICALYRKKNSAEKSSVKSSVLADPSFSYCDAMSVTQLAEFLIDGDPQCKLKRTVSDVRQKDPKVLSKCKDLAIRYYEKLFELYQKGQDPFFRPKL